MKSRRAQDKYTTALHGVKLVLVLSTIHGSASATCCRPVRLVCVDINPAVVTKLADRGSSQTNRHRHRRRDCFCDSWPRVVVASALHP